MDLTLSGFHHLTAISADIRGNKEFFTEDLGMRLVKRSVNQDDVSAYHLFYSDGVGSPGNDMTFFDWPAPPERRGNNSITRTGLRVRDEASLAYWASRLKARGVSQRGVSERDGRSYLDFEDREGQRLTFVADGGAGDESVPWTESPVPAEHQVRGLGPITITVPDLEPTRAVLERVMAMQELRDYPDPEAPQRRVHVFQMGTVGPQAELHVAVRPELPPARQGAGGVHHVAFRVATFAEYDGWAERLQELRVPNSGRVDRFWFRSLYFREPNGILFELATDEPGFAVDEPLESLGESLVLPPFLEPRRAAIEAGLKPLDRQPTP